MADVSLSIGRLYERAYEPLICAIAFSLPLYFLGIPSGGFDFTLLVVLVLVLDALILLNGKFVIGTTRALTIFVVWCFLTAVGRYSPSSYLVSLLGLIAVTFPLCGPVPQNVRPRRVLNGLIYGLLVTFVFAAYEVMINFVGVPPLESFFSYGVWANIRTGEYLGFRRVKATFVEPARYAQYLSLVYAIIDAAGRRGVEIRYRRWLLGGILVALISTLSLSGVIIMAGYFGASFLLNARERLTAPLRSEQFWKMTLFVWTPLAVGIAVMYGDAVAEIAALFRERLDKVVEVIQFGILVGSEGSRVQSTLIMFDYVSGQDWVSVLIGEGYSNAEQWLQENFTFLLGTKASFARGDLHNIFSTVTISTGVVGLSAYVYVLYSVFRQRTRSVPLLFIAVVFVLHFATGYLLYTRLWMTILVAQIIFGRFLQARRSSGAEQPSDREETGDPDEPRG
jgi:hypothetical protein